MTKKPTNIAETAIARHGSTTNLQEQRRMHALSEAIRANRDHSAPNIVETAKKFETYLDGKTK